MHRHHHHHVVVVVEVLAAASVVLLLLVHQGHHHRHQNGDCIFVSCYVTSTTSTTSTAYNNHNAWASSARRSYYRRRREMVTMVEMRKKRMRRRTVSSPLLFPSLRPSSYSTKVVTETTLKSAAISRSVAAGSDDVGADDGHHDDNCKSQYNASANRLDPPTPRREEDRVVYAGIKNNDVLRRHRRRQEEDQSVVPRKEREDDDEENNDNENDDDDDALSLSYMDPPVAIHDPYGWIHPRRLHTSSKDDDDDEKKRTTKEEIEELIDQENRYTEYMTSHLSSLRQELIDEWMRYDGVDNEDTTTSTATDTDLHDDGDFDDSSNLFLEQEEQQQQHQRQQQKRKQSSTIQWIKLPVRKGPYWYYTVLRTRPRRREQRGHNHSQQSRQQQHRQNESYSASSTNTTSSGRSGVYYSVTARLPAGVTTGSRTGTGTKFGRIDNDNDNDNDEEDVSDIIDYIQQSESIQSQSPKDSSSCSRTKSRRRHHSPQHHPYMIAEEDIILDENLLVENYRKEKTATSDDSTESSSSSNANSAATSSSSSSSSYVSVHSVVVSPDHQQVVYSVDMTGNEKFQLYWKSLSRQHQPNPPSSSHNNDEQTEEIRASSLPPEHPKLLVSAMCGSVVWNKDNTRLYMLQADETTGRPYKLVEYHLKKKTVQVLYEESDVLYSCHIQQSFDEEYLMVVSTGPTKNSTKYFVLSLIATHYDCDGDGDAVYSHSKALTRINYPNMTSLEHGDRSWFMIQNENSVFRLCGDECDDSDDDADDNDDSLWKAKEVLDIHNKPLFPIDDNTLSLNSIKVLPENLVVQGRQGGLPRIWVVRLDDDDDGNGDGTNHATATSVQLLQWDEPAHYVKLEEFSMAYPSTSSLSSSSLSTSTAVVVSYQSMITPQQFLKVDLKDISQRTLLYEQKIPGYDRTDYVCEHISIPSRDGEVEIPVSFVRRKGTQTTAMRRPVPLHLFGYGAYGHSLECAFSTLRIPLLNRGLIWATAHVRGGGELGTTWHEMGTKERKINSINDFVDVAKFMIDTSYTNPSLLSCEGRSAGGLLAASAVNQMPHLFRVALLGVPFLDVLTSMTDESLPLTTVEWNEWGNPNTWVGYESMKQFCPLQTIPVDTAIYPRCLLVGGINDPRVPFSDPLKFAAAVRFRRQKSRKYETIDGGGGSCGDQTTQAPQSSSNEICVWIDPDAGHSFGNDRDKYYTELSLFYAFLLDHIKAKKITRPIMDNEFLCIKKNS